MPSAYFFILSATELQLGANAKLQAVKFALSLAVGLVAGVVALLYFRKSGKAERFVTDLFATLCLGGGYILCLELFFGGKFELYGIFAYFVGASAIPFSFKWAKRLLANRRENADEAQE
ncbi:MAG: hypothetical protein J5713_00650 [Clostridia bacterium]|nr:hypothetical protein [Clostridia bacterium]